VDECKPLVHGGGQRAGRGGGGASRVAAIRLHPHGKAVRVTIFHPISIWEIDMGDRFGIRYIDMVVYHIDMDILDVDMESGLMMWDMLSLLKAVQVGGPRLISGILRLISAVEAQIR
jgi:hypothetical protein